MDHITTADFEIQFNNLIYYGEYRVQTYNHTHTSATYLQPAESDCEFEVIIEELTAYDTIKDDYATDPNANQNEAEVKSKLNEFVTNNINDFID